MTTSKRSSYEMPPVKVAPPADFKAIELFPAVSIKATRARVAKFADVVQREDELGPCRVAHFEVDGTLLVFYQSVTYPSNYWMVFVDMIGCVKRAQPPTLLGASAVHSLTNGKLAPDWKNAPADTEYQSRTVKELMSTPLRGRPVGAAGRNIRMSPADALSAVRRIESFRLAVEKTLMPMVNLTARKNAVPQLSNSSSVTTAEIKRLQALREQLSKTLASTPLNEDLQLIEKFAVWVQSAQSDIDRLIKNDVAIPKKVQSPKKVAARK